MYEFIRGVVVSRTDDAVVLDTGGVGYRLSVSRSTLRKVPEAGETTLFAYLLVREDEHLLYGFADEGERHLFRQLLQVSGVGPAVALGLLSAHEPEALASRIASGDLLGLTSVKGVGKRTGERILVELRDRFRKTAGVPAAAPATGARADAVLALCSLGLRRAEAERRVAAVEGAELPVEELVKQALRSVG